MMMIIIIIIIIIIKNNNERTIRQSKLAIPKGVKNCGWLVIMVLVNIIMIIKEIKYHTYMHIFQLDKEVAN